MCLWKKTPYQICFLCRTEMFYLFHVIRLIIWIEIWNKTVRRHNWNRRAQSTLVFLWAQVWTGAGFKRTAIINDAPNVTSVVFPSNGKVQRWEPLNNPWKKGDDAHEQKLHIGHNLIDKISELVWLGFLVGYETNGQVNEAFRLCAVSV